MNTLCKNEFDLKTLIFYLFGLVNFSCQKLSNFVYFVNFCYFNFEMYIAIFVFKKKVLLRMFLFFYLLQKNLIFIIIFFIKFSRSSACRTTKSQRVRHMNFFLLECRFSWLQRVRLPRLSRLYGNIFKKKFIGK